MVQVREIINTRKQVAEKNGNMFFKNLLPQASHSNGRSTQNDKHGKT